MAVEGNFRPAWAEIDLDALRANAAVMAKRVAPSALCAVVKADGYGHGAVTAAVAFLEGGAEGLAVAIVDEGVELRQARIIAPILLLSEPPAEAMTAALAAGLTPTLTTLEGVRACADAAKQIGATHPVHIKVDTGMHRMGVEVEDLAELLSAIEAEDQLVIEGLWTHFSVADEGSEESRAFTAAQLERFDEAVAIAAGLGIHPPVLHVANSAASLALPSARRTMVRCGLALYGDVPSEDVAAVASAEAPLELRPAMAIKAAVSAIHDVPAAARPSYGRRRPMPAAGRVATVPIGYADGFPRSLFDAGHEVLIGGQRFPLAGSVTMDQILVDVGDVPVAVGDEVVLLGTQGTETISVSEWASHLDTISWEVFCGIGPRVPRREVGTPPAERVTVPMKRRWWRPRG